MNIITQKRKTLFLVLNNVDCFAGLYGYQEIFDYVVSILVSMWPEIKVIARFEEELPDRTLKLNAYLEIESGVETKTMVDTFLELFSDFGSDDLLVRGVSRKMGSLFQIFGAEPEMIFCTEDNVNLDSVMGGLCVKAKKAPRRIREIELL